MTNGEIYNKWLWEDDGNNTAFDLMEAVRADERAKVLEELKAKFTRKDEDGNLYIFAWYDELKEQK